MVLIGPTVFLLSGKEFRPIPWRKKCMGMAVQFFSCCKVVDTDCVVNTALSVHQLTHISDVCIQRACR